MVRKDTKYLYFKKEKIFHVTQKQKQQKKNTTHTQTNPTMQGERETTNILNVI